MLCQACDERLHEVLSLHDRLSHFEPIPPTLLLMSHCNPKPYICKYDFNLLHLYTCVVYIWISYIIITIIKLLIHKTQNKGVSGTYELFHLGGALEFGNYWIYCTHTECNWLTCKSIHWTIWGQSPFLFAVQPPLQHCIEAQNLMLYLWELSYCRNARWKKFGKCS